MAYFIGNGAVTIGGGSLGRTEQLPSLKILCVDLCARHLERLGDLGDIPTEVFIDLLKRAKEKATPEIVKRFQDINERLWCEEVDTAFWKQAVEGHILRRIVPAPGPVLVDRVNGHKERLNVLLADDETDGKEWSRDVIKVFEALEETPVSVGLLKKTLIGKAVSPFRKSVRGGGGGADPRIARMAMDLVRRWKEAAAAAAAAAAISGGDGNGTIPSTGSDSGRGGAGGEGAGAASAAAGAEGVQRCRSPAEDKQRMVEEGFRCRTWESLYQHLELLKAEKVRASSRRAREAREREQQKRPKMIVGKSRGQDFTTKTGRISGRISAPSFFASSGTASASASPSSSLPLRAGFSPAKKVKRSNSARNSYGGGSSTNSSSSSSSNNNIRNRGSGGGRTTPDAGGRGGGSKKRKQNDYNSGTSSIAELRRKVVNDQRLSVPVKVKTPGGRGGSAAGGGGAGATSSPKRSSFWK